jgi:hypothetical protein
VWISLTPRGNKVLRKAEALQKQALKRAVAGIPVSTLKRVSKDARGLASALLVNSANKSDNCLQCCAYNTTGCVYEQDDWRCQYRLRYQKTLQKTAK